jgi:hypothetical protein
MPKFDSHPFDPAPEVSNPALNGSADRLTAVPSHKPHEIRQSRDVPQAGYYCHMGVRYHLSTVKNVTMWRGGLDGDVARST